MKTTNSTDLKRAELLGSVGIFLLGAGLGSLTSDALAQYAAILVLGGGLMHGLAMYGKHRTEIAQGIAAPSWYRALYWSCWALLTLLAIWLAIS
ncbi:hypothetical protein [Lysobacter niastensis]|uniref:Uncharacterized protein n=1 Tax=Lysobacter niastensis TaxID=380629 RepID=A0ABS0BAK5_9GAMM|nr:hypothetical protein [Lysobacter niastensis]MBF6024877.1 hypothetical protein [Lysobacter niastensis]